LRRYSNDHPEEKMTKKCDLIDVESVVVEVQSKSLLDRVGDYLTAKDWSFSSYAEKQYFSLGLRLRDGNVRVIVEASEVAGWSRLLVYVTYHTFVPEPRRLDVAGALARINYISLFGNMEMDMKDGEVRVRTVLEDEGYIGEQMIDRAVRRAMDLADQYQAALLAIAFGNAQAQDVLDLAARDDGATLQ
jgi:hypothetical protein